MSDRINLVDAYSNRSVVAKLAKMEDEINGAEDSISQQTKDFEKMADTKVASITTAGDTAVSRVEATRDSVVSSVTQAGTQAVADVNSAGASAVQQVQDLLDGLDATVAKAEAAATTAEQASKTADEASDKAEAAAKSVDDDVVAAANAVVDAKAYATTGILHDGTTVTSADAIEKQCETLVSQAENYAESAGQIRDEAQEYATKAGEYAGNAQSSFVDAQIYAEKAKASESACQASATEAAASATSAGTYAGQCLTYSQACAQSAESAKTWAQSLNPDNLVDLSTDQTIGGSKEFEAISGRMGQMEAIINYSSDTIKVCDIKGWKGIGYPLYFSFLCATPNETGIFTFSLSMTAKDENVVTGSVTGSLFTLAQSYTGFRVYLKYPKSFTTGLSTVDVSLYVAHYGASYKTQEMKPILLSAMDHYGKKLDMDWAYEKTDVASITPADDDDWKLLTLNVYSM